MPKTALKVAGVVFLLVALLHLSRLAFKFNLVVGESVVPVWVNAIGFAIAAGLSFWMFKSEKNL